MNIQGKHNIQLHSRGPFRAFTLVEMLVTLTVIAVIAVVVLPQFQNTNRLRVMAASQVLVSDIEAAQVFTISLPEDPIVVRFDPENVTYWLASVENPDTPILHDATGEPYTVTFGEGRALSAAGVSISLTNCPDNTLTFDASGGLADFTNTPVIRLSYGSSAVEIVVSPTTGTVFEREIGE